MASSLQLYSTASIYVNGSLLAEEASVSVKRSTNAQNVLTVAKGFAGQSPGAAMAEVSVESAVPSDDFELNPGKFMTELKVVEITIFAAGNTLTLKGFITEDNFSHAVNSESKLSFSATCSYADWE